MVHLYCKVTGIKDTSRGGAYHNKKFKEESIRHGFYYPSDKPDPKIGWSYSKITDETKEVIDSLDLIPDVFKIARATFGYLPGMETSDQTAEDEDESEEEGPKRSHIIKWVCPTCENIVRSSKEVNIKCGDCDVTFVKSK
ncbi:hypothetical protein ACFOQM_11060 [Paenibacillus sp. GCM10012307]|uniref:Uncharacterized protein n=1 Tax=Paenibacillus roseus TaxID=2798579 RepID=A0A934ML61_9BACL|nr:hypothetical protein [Paenibacillus roseus]MBJ6361825.1 hypothetical protein [Paenibacillus roseus]